MSAIQVQTSGSEGRKSDSVDPDPTPAQPPIMRRDDLVGAIMRVTGGDGIHSSMAPDTVGDNANRATKLRGLFTNRGTTDLGDGGHEPCARMRISMCATANTWPN